MTTNSWISITEPPKAQVKVWDSIEMNGFIMVWHHSEGLKPDWFPQRIDSIHNKDLVFRGMFDYTVKCHIQVKIFSITKIENNLVQIGWNNIRFY